MIMSVFFCFVSYLFLSRRERWVSASFRARRRVTHNLFSLSLTLFFSFTLFAPSAHTQGHLEKLETLIPNLETSETLLPTLLSPVIEGVDRVQREQRKKKSPPIDMNADHLDMDKEEGIIKAEGNVHVIQAGFLELRADQAQYHFSSNQITASGNIRLAHRGDLFTSERVVFDVVQQKGSLEQVNINLRGPGGRATAKSVLFRHESEGEDRDFFTLGDVAFTHCECGLDEDLSEQPWHFTSREVEVDRANNQLTAKDVRLYAGHVPVFAFPWWQQPLIPKRKSGFLQPSFRVSGNGFESEIPYYWNIKANQDATLALRSITQRGLMTKLQYRYMDRNFKGQLDTHGIYDTLDEEYRGLTVFEHEHTLGNWKVQSHLEGSRTRDYIHDFSQELVDNRSRRLESHTTLDRIWAQERSYTSFQSGVRWYQDLEKENDDFTVQSLPFALLTDRRILGRDSVSENNFDSARGRWRLDSETRLDNFYQLAGNSAQRFDIAPVIHFQKPIYMGYASAAFGVRETAYLLHGDPEQTGEDQTRTLHRESTLLSLRLDSTLHRSYGTSYQHTLEPTVQYVLNSSTDQSQLPNYDASLRSFTITDIFARNLYSGVDRISEGQWVGYGVTSRLLARNEQNVIQEKGVFTIGQRWAPKGNQGFQEERAFSSVASSLEIKISEQISAATMIGFNPYEEEVESSDTVLSIVFSGTNRDRDDSTQKKEVGRVTLGHHFNNPNAVNNINSDHGLEENGREKVDDLSLDASLRLSDRWLWNQRSDYSLEIGELKSWGAGLVYEHPCWNLNLTGGRELATTTNKHGGTFIGLFINLQGLGGVGI